MTRWRVTTDYQRPTNVKPPKAYSEDLGYMLFQVRQSMQRNLCHLSGFLEDLLHSEDLVRCAMTRTKTALAILSP